MTMLHSRRTLWSSTAQTRLTAGKEDSNDDGAGYTH